MSTVVVTACIDHLESLIRAVPEVHGRVFHVYSEEELMEKTKALIFPSVGLVYGGMRSVPTTGGSRDLGLSAELTASLILAFKTSNAKSDPRDTAVSLLDKFRVAIHGQRSPSGHFWKFTMESALQGDSGVLYYFQRWSCPVQLT